jgi:hypothetical protein
MLKPAMRELRKLRKVLDEILLQRYLVDHEQYTLDSHLSDFFGKIGCFLDDLDEVLPGLQDQTEKQRIKGQADDIRNDFSGLRDYAERVRARKGTLNEKEHDLSRREDRLKNLMESAETESATDDADDESVAEDEGPEMDPLLLEYYDHKGNANIFQERLDLLEEDYGDATLRRDMLTDRGDPVDEPEDVFERRFQEEREKLLQQIDSESRIARGLYAACVKQGLLVDDGIGEPALDLAIPEDTDSAVQNAFLSEPPSGQASYTMTPTRASHVHGWLGGVDGSPTANDSLTASPVLVPRRVSYNGQARVDFDYDPPPDDVPRETLLGSPNGDLETRPLSTVDPESGLGVTVLTYPVESITDPELLRQGMSACCKVLSSGAVGDEAVLYSGHSGKPSMFFKVGRVFEMLWPDIVGDGATQVTSLEQSDQPATSRVISSKVRRFVIIRENRDYCSALPVATYGKQGVGKPGVVKSEHCVIYTGSQPPQISQQEIPSMEEGAMRTPALKLDPSDPTEKLDPMSRVDFGKVYTIAHAVMVKSLGSLGSRSIGTLKSHFKQVWALKIDTAATDNPSAERDHEYSEQSETGQASPRTPFDRPSAAAARQIKSARKRFQDLLKEDYTREGAYQLMTEQLLGKGYMKETALALMAQAGQREGGPLTSEGRETEAGIG